MTGAKMWMAALVVCLSASQCLCSDDPTDVVKSDPAISEGCGADCLVYVTHRLARSECDRIAAERMVDPDGNGECSIADLMRSFGASGIPAAALHSDSKTLPSGMSLLLVRTTFDDKVPSHFVVVEAADVKFPGSRVTFVPYLGITRFHEDRIRDLWDGDFISFGATGTRGIGSVVGWVVAIAAGVGVGSLLAWVRTRR